MENQPLDYELDQQEEANYFDYDDASQGVRFANFIIDRIVSFVLTVVVGVGLALAGMEEMLEGIQSYLVGFVVYFIYYALSEGLTGKTLGKLITGTRVVNDYGERPDMSTIMGRTLCRFIPFEAFSFLGTRGWHDSITNTRVVVG